MQIQQTSLPEPPAPPKNPIKRAIQKAIESKQTRKTFPEYRRFIKSHYDGLAGKLTVLTGLLTGHAALAGKVLKSDAFDLTGCKRILDAGCGNGRYCRPILRRADADAFISAFDLSQSMLRRAHRRIKSSRVQYVAADMTRLPFSDAVFDAIVCGWALEHLPDPRLGLREMARVLRHGGKMLLWTTEDTLAGSVCSRMWHCRTYNRQEIRLAAEESGLVWHRPYYFSDFHRFFKLGGIIVELRRP